MQTRRLWSLVLAMAMTPVLVGQDDKGDQEAVEQQEPTVQEQLVAMRREYQMMMRDLGAKFRSAKTEEERSAVMDQRLETEGKLAQQAMELAQKAMTDDPDNGKDAAGEVLVWVATGLSGEAAEAAKEKLLADFMDSKVIGRLTATLARGMPSEKTEKLLRRIYTESPEDSVKANALMSLTNLLGTMKQISELPEETQKALAAQLGEEFIAKWTAEAIDEEMETLLEEAKAKFADIPYGRRTIGEEAETQLFVLRNLAIGKVAPDIEGEDIDGEVFKLSDYRGKVVVLDFWGDW